MSKHLKILRFVAVTAMLCGPAMAEENIGIDAVVASVNGQKITLGHMMMVRESLPEQYLSLPDDVLFSGILDQIVQQMVLAQSMKGDETPRIRLSLENERRLMSAGEVINRILQEGMTEADVQAAYDAKYATDFSGPMEFNASHILVDTIEEATKIREQLLGGADFAETAKTMSTGPSGPSGGSLGWFGPGAMVPTFEQAVTTMKPGEISEPTKTNFGWHIIKLNDARAQAAPTLDAVRDDLVNELQQTLVDARVAELTEKATIDRSAVEAFDPALLKQIDLLDASEGN